MALVRITMTGRQKERTSKFRYLNKQKIQPHERGQDGGQITIPVHLLPELFGTLLIPQAVYTECVLDGRGYQESTRIAQARWLQPAEASSPAILFA